MLKCILLVVVALTGGVAAVQEGINQQNQIYIVSGVLGGVCLVLTIAAVFNTVSIIRLQTRVAVLQATTPAAGRTFVEAPRTQQPLPRGEELNKYPPVEDPYRGASNRENYRMERPVPPPRPQRPAHSTNYY